MLQVPGGKDGRIQHPGGKDGRIQHPVAERGDYAAFNVLPLRFRKQMVSELKGAWSDKFLGHKKAEHTKLYE